MTSFLPGSRDHLTAASAELLFAAGIVRDAAEVLAEEAEEIFDANRFFQAAERLTIVLRLPQVSRSRLLQASPALTERSGRTRHLVEMIEAEPGDQASRLRLAKLLFRALVWRPETFPYPPA